MLKILKNELYDVFECTMGNCPSNCCDEDWTIFIDNEAYDRICSLGLVDIDSVITREEPHVLIKKNHKCPFITEEGLCTIHRNYGPEYLSNTCRSYPRFVSGYGDVYTMTLGISCPEVARLTMELDRPLVFNEEFHYEDKSEIGRRDLKLPSEDVLEGLLRHLEGDCNVFDAVLRMENEVGRILESDKISVVKLMDAVRKFAVEVGEGSLFDAFDFGKCCISMNDVLDADIRLKEIHPYLSINIVRNCLFERIMYYESNNNITYGKTVAAAKIRMVILYGVLIINSFFDNPNDDDLIRLVYRTMRLIDHDDNMIDRLMDVTV